ncbi:hypothetical protein [Parabacteroides sp.]
MIVDRERKVIYLHNPKSGGTFLRSLYIKKYGQTEATKWWELFTKEHGTDLGHISYDDLPRFIPDWKEYRVIVMVRNPYNRFYSAVKELKDQTRLFKVNRIIELPMYVVFGEYQKWGRFRKIYEFLLFICPGTYKYYLLKLRSASIDNFCKQVSGFKHDKQDCFLRNKRLPWLNPQSDFMGENVEVFYYESRNDWNKLLEIFGLSEYSDSLLIAKDYLISDDIRTMIENLYPEDRDLFLKYKD